MLDYPWARRRMEEPRPLFGPVNRALDYRLYDTAAKETANDPEAFATMVFTAWTRTFHREIVATLDSILPNEKPSPVFDEPNAFLAFLGSAAAQSRDDLIARLIDLQPGKYEFTVSSHRRLVGRDFTVAPKTHPYEFVVDTRAPASTPVRVAP